MKNKIGNILDKIKIYKYVSIIGMSLIGLCYLINLNNSFIIEAKTEVPSIPGKDSIDIIKKNQDIDRTEE